MRLLYQDEAGEFSLTKDLVHDDSIPPYAILSHTWGQDLDDDEVTFEDIIDGTASKQNKPGYEKLRFCGEQARRDGLSYFWVDACCINRANLVELSEAITSMFRWYHRAVKCYVHLSDVQVQTHDEIEDDWVNQTAWESAFRKSRWFTRGWTLQELIAPESVEFYSRQGALLGSKQTLERDIQEITGLPISVLRGTPLHQFSIEERLSWAQNRKTTKEEDGAYCLIGIFGISMPLIYGEREMAFTRLKAEVEKSQTVPSSDRVNVHWTLTRSPNSLFTGRRDILDNLEATIRASVHLNPPPTQCRIVISGIGGQGKSEICVQLSHRVQLLLWGVFWVDFSTISTAKNDFMKIAKQLNIPAESWEDGRQGLANIQRPWMLILDNMDDPNVDYRDFIPSGTFGIIVLTTRSKECEQYADPEHRIALEGLPTVDGRELLLRAAEVSNHPHNATEDDAYNVAKLLQFHPLALIQAGVYIRHGYCTLAEYPNEYQRHRKRLLEFQRSQAKSRYQHVYATFEASIEILQTMNTEPARDALDLLSILAVCAPNQFPLWLFKCSWMGVQRKPWRKPRINKRMRLTKSHISRLPPLMQVDTTEWDSFRLMQAVNVLTSVAIVSTSTRDGQKSVSMHPLIHAWARDRQNDQEQHESWLRMGSVIAAFYSEPDFWFLNRWQLLSHIQALVSWDLNVAFGEKSKDVKTVSATKGPILNFLERFGWIQNESIPQEMIVYILNRSGWILHDNNDEASVVVLLDKLFTYLGINDSIVTEQWSDLYHLRSLSLRNKGKHKEAVAVFEPVYKIYERALPEDHSDRLALAHDLFYAYILNGQAKEGDEVQKYIVKACDKRTSEGHERQLSSSIALATGYLGTGKNDEGIKIFESLIEICQQTLPEDHPDRLLAEKGLGLSYVIKGEDDKGLPLLEHVVKVQEQINGEHLSSETATFQSVLMSKYLLKRDFNKAAYFIKPVLEKRERTLPEGHHDLFNTQNLQASVFWGLGQHESAIALLTKAIEGQKNMPDGNIPNLKECEGLLAQWTAHVSSLAGSATPTESTSGNGAVSEEGISQT